MASEVRVNKIQSQSGLGTMTLTDGGPEFTGITTITTGNVDGNCLYLKNEEVGLYFGNWGTGSTYPRTSTINATRTDSSTPLPVLRVAGQGGLEFASDLNTVRMSIDSSGRVTSPYQPAFHAYNNATQSIGTSGTVKILAQVADVNRGSIWDTSTSRFTAPVSGVYKFSASVCFEYNGGSPGTDDSAFMGLYKNGSDYNFSNANGTNPRNRIGINPQYYARDGVEFAQTGIWLIDLAASDYIEFYIRDVNTSGPRIESCLLNGYLIG